MRKGQEQQESVQENLQKLRTSTGACFTKVSESYVMSVYKLNKQQG